jgi:RHS repeat-associated protein
VTVATVDERAPLPGPAWPPSAPPTSFPLADRRPVVLADDPCEAGFSGADPEYAGIYLHARYFDPKLGTFLSPDPIGVNGGLNQYGYGFGDPVNRLDPSGLACQKARSSTNGGPWTSWTYYGDCATTTSTSPLPFPRTDYGFYAFLPFLIAGTGYGSAARDGQQNYTAPLPQAAADPPAGGEDQGTGGTSTSRSGPVLFVPPGGSFEYPTSEFPEEAFLETAAFCAVFGASCTPGLGELMDWQVVMSPEFGTLAKVLAGFSLILSAASDGLLPNAGALLTKNGVGITGFTKHAVNQAIERGVAPAAIKDALKNPLQLGSVKIDSLGRPSQTLVGRSATVVVNPQTGQIVTLYPTSSRRARKLLGEP